MSALTHWRGWRSTKLHLALIVIGVLTVVYAAMGFPAGLFSIYTTAVIAAGGLYSGAAAAEKFAPAPPATPPSGVDNAG